MTKSTFNTFVIIGLLVSNLILAGFLFFGKPHPNRQKPREKVIQVLGFDDAQIARYDVFIKKHRAQVTDFEKKAFEAKTALYECLNGSDLSKRDSLLESLASMQFAIETIHYKHFEEIKSICRPDQLANFATLTEDLVSIFNHKKPPHK